MFPDLPPVVPALSTEAHVAAIACVYELGHLVPAERASSVDARSPTDTVVAYLVSALVLATHVLGELLSARYNDDLCCPRLLTASPLVHLPGEASLVPQGAIASIPGLPTDIAELVAAFAPGKGTSQH